MIEDIPETAEARAERRAQNLRILQLKYPEVFKGLDGFEPQSELVFNDAGEPDVVFQGRHFYDGEYRAFLDKQVQKFKTQPNRIRLAPPNAHQFDSYAAHYLDRLMARTKLEMDLTLARYRQTEEAFYTIVCGAGLCFHLPEIIKVTNCRNLFLLEPTWEFIWHSLEVFDWVEFLKEMEEGGRDIFFLVNRDAQSAFDFFRYRTRMSNPSSMDGTYYYQHYDTPLFREFTKIITQDSPLLITGLGFFFDECVMISNCKRNLEDGTSRLYVEPEGNGDVPTPLFVIGSGPSLDKDYEHIRRLQDRALIMSCGTAISPLMKNGIRPDFHVEMENVGVHLSLDQVKDKFDLSETYLISASTVEPGTAAPFKGVIYYFRPALCPFFVFSSDMSNCLLHVDPTVVNTGLSFALAAHFKNIYFFGVDLGKKGTDLHHSKFAYQYTEGAVAPEIDFNMEMPANFGGKAYTFDGLYWARDSIQRAIRMTTPRRKFINCSDGVMIEGTTAKLGRKLDLPPLKTAKKVSKDRLTESFPVFTKERFDQCWNGDDIVEAINIFCDDIRQLLAEEGPYSLELLSRLGPLLRTPVNRGNLNAFAATALRGTLHQIFVILDFYGPRTQSEEDLAGFLKIAGEELHAILDLMQERLIENIRTLDRGDVPEESLFDGKDLMSKRQSEFAGLT